jgi:hypothetical protein
MVETLDWRLIVSYQHGQTVAFRKEGKLLEGKFVGSIRLLNGKTAHGVDVKGEVYFFTSPLVCTKDVKQAATQKGVAPDSATFQ